MAVPVTTEEPTTKKEEICPDPGFHVVYQFTDDSNNRRVMYQPCKEEVRDVRMFADFLACFRDMPLLHQAYFDLPWEDLVAVLDKHEEVISEYVSDFGKKSFVEKMAVVKLMHDTVLEESDIRFFHRVGKITVAKRDENGLHTVDLAEL